MGLDRPLRLGQRLPGPPRDADAGSRARPGQLIQVRTPATPAQQRSAAGRAALRAAAANRSEHAMVRHEAVEALAALGERRIARRQPAQTKPSTVSARAARRPAAARGWDGSAGGGSLLLNVCNVIAESA